MSEPMEKVIEDLKTSMNATATHLAFLENIGHHSFRRTLKLSDVELRERIDAQNLNIIQMSREHLLAWKWINESGRLPVFNEYRMKVQEALKAEAKAEEQREFEKFTDVQLGQPWKAEKGNPHPDWRDIPMHVRWIAQDVCGMWIGFSKEPMLDSKGNWCPSDNEYASYFVKAKKSTVINNWKETKEKRPDSYATQGEPGTVQGDPE